jgi:L-aspartate oxidase
VYLDLKPLGPERVRQRFPGIVKSCAEFGIDVTTDPVPVRPGAHYMIGGVRVDNRGGTSIAGLWAAGEVTSSGLHGANRLGSNSLLEGLVYGAHAGEAASAAALELPDTFQAIPLENPVQQSPGEPLDLQDIRNSLKSLMWRSAGVRREGEQLGEAAQTIDGWRQYVLNRQLVDPIGWELQNMLAVSRLIIEAALRREESRGVHQRSDFPEQDDTHWQRRCGLQRTDGLK